MIVFQIRRHHVEVLYSTTLAVRVLLVVVIIAAYVESGDPMFLTLTGIVGLGMALTAIGLFTDRHGAKTLPTRT